MHEQERQYLPLAEPFTDGPFVPAWQPQTVEQVPRRLSLSAAVLATAITVLVPAPSALEAAARATYPDRVSRAQVHASGQQAFAYHPDPIAAAPAVPEQWTPSYPDRVPRPATLSTAAQQSIAQIIGRGDQTAAGASDSGIITRPAQIQYQSITGPVLVPAVAVVVPELSWAAQYPSQHLRLRPVALSQVVAPVAPLGGTDLRWAPSFPVWIAGKPYRVALHQVSAQNLLPIPNEDAPARSWAPAYPDQHLRDLTPVTAHQSLAWHPAANRAPEFAWQPDYPDWIARRVLLTAAQQALAFDVDPRPNPPELVWLARYPDQLLPAARLLTGRQQAWAANLDPIADRLTELSWAPRYPVWLDRRVVHPSRLPWLAAPVAPLTVPLGSWDPTYPDRLVRRAPVPWGVSVGPVVPLDGGDLRWLAQYPVQHLRRRLHPSLQQALAFRVTTEPDPLPDLSWQGDYPEWIARRTYPVAARSFATTPLSPILPVTALTWQGEYADRVPRLLYLPGRQQVVALYPTPITPPTVVELSWLARYPDSVLRPETLAALQQAFTANLDPIDTSALVPLSWESHYPSLLLPRGWVRPLGTIYVAPAEMVEVVVHLAPWHPVYPDRLHQRPLPTRGPEPLVPIDLPTLANAYTCIELTLDAAQSGIRSWTVRQSSLEGAVVEHITGAGFTVC